MVIFPNCKINLGLHVTAKRTDGFHDIETVFFPVKLCDVLETVRSASNTTLLHLSGISVDGNPEENICFKAYQLLKADFPSIPSLDIYLHKAIPLGAGLGGGSADGAFMLQLLNEQFQLGLSADQLTRYALQLGSDCPFFIINQPCYATGRGEIMQPAVLDLSAYKIIIVNPGIHVHTGAAFKELSPALPEKSIRDTVKQPVETWTGNLVNDFEKPVFARHPEIAAIKESLYKGGALYASMSGSGSTVYGLFRPETLSLPAFPAHYLVKTV